jgi:hypothetical protein
LGEVLVESLNFFCHCLATKNELITTIITHRNIKRAIIPVVTPIVMAWSAADTGNDVAAMLFNSLNLLDICISDDDGIWVTS